MQLKSNIARRLGKRAASYLEDHAIDVGRHGQRSVILADRYETPDGVVRTLTRRYGRPRTIDRGETAYWSIPASDLLT